MESVDDIICIDAKACGYIEGEEIGQEWDFGVIALTFVIASCGAFTSLTITSHLRHCKNQRWYQIFIGASGFGLGINTVWCMHFVGMQALQLRGGLESGAEALLGIGFEFTLTIFSGVSVWAIACAGLHIMANRHHSRRMLIDRELFVRLGAATWLIAGGVCVMHFSGMASQSGQFSMTWDPLIVLVSCTIAAIASCAGLCMLMVLKNGLRARVASACVISVAVNGMHYVGMFAARYHVRLDHKHQPTDIVIQLDAQVVAITALVLDLVLYTVCSFYGEIQRAHWEDMRRKTEAKRDQELQRTVAAAVKSTDELGHPMCVLPAQHFLALRAQDLSETYERLREAGKLKVFDTMQSVAAEKDDGCFIVFFSYENLKKMGGGPNMEQLTAMQDAVKELGVSLGWSEDGQMSKFYIWLDCISIPQRNRAMKVAAINSIYTYSSIPDAMVIICPTTHAEDGRIANDCTIRDRLWCRVEHVAFYCSRGMKSTYVHRGVALEELPEDWMRSVCCVFEAKSTCCSRLHEFSPTCDRENVVLPLLALYFDIMSRYTSGDCTDADKAAWELIAEHKGRMFPRNFAYATESGNEQRKLFDDMVERVDDLIRDRKMSITASTSRVLSRPFEDLAFEYLSV